MLDRYMSEAMTAVFSDEARFAYWRRVELAVLAGYAHAGMFDREIVDAVGSVPSPTADAVKLREYTTGHDVVAFLQEWTAGMPADVSCWVHRGLTSSDIVDTALALALRDASDLILTQLDHLVVVLVDHALVHRGTVRIGRTHGQHATVDVWGHRVADFAFAADRARSRMRLARDAVLVAKLSGTTGCYAQVPPAVERHAAQILDLSPVEVATQIVMRDRLTVWIFALAMAAGVCEAIALEVRLGQRSEVAELAEASGAVRIGSSSMPHKNNPITSEKICGLARLVRGFVSPVLEGVALWHERDLTHSSVERVAVPDAAAITEHVLECTVEVMSTLVVNVDRMGAGVSLVPVATISNGALVRLTVAGLPWAAARELVERAAKQDSMSGAAEFVTRLEAVVTAEHPEVGHGWATGLDEPDPVQLDAVFERLAQITVQR